MIATSLFSNDQLLVAIHQLLSPIPLGYYCCVGHICPSDELAQRKICSHYQMNKAGLKRKGFDQVPILLVRVKLIMKMKKCNNNCNIDISNNTNRYFLTRRENSAVNVFYLGMYYGSFTKARANRVPCESCIDMFTSDYNRSCT